MHVGLGRRLWWRGRRRNEVDFWAGWLTGAPGTEQWADDREERLNPEAEIRDPVVRAELERSDAQEISILDVGAGPLTWLGYRYSGKQLTIVPVDPLASEYDRLVRKAGLEPPVRTIPVAGEALLEHFEPGSFDIAYATNALDHSANPLTIISNMVTVVRPGGSVILRHKHNEGANARYSGLHAWNFDTVDGQLLLWNEATEVDVGAALAERAETTAWREDNEVVARLAVREAPDSGGLDLEDLELERAARGRHLDDLALLRPMIALPTGDSFESFCSAGFASAEPTIRYSNVLFAPMSRSLTSSRPRRRPWRCPSSRSRARQQPLLERRDPVLEQRLLVLRVVVLGVLGDVAELAGDADPVCDLAPLARSRGTRSPASASRSPLW